MDAATIAQVEKLALDMRSRLGGRVRNFRLVFEGSGLILFGQVDTYHAKQLVLQSIMEETDLPLLANEIEVVRAR